MLKILYIEDDEGDQLMVRRALKKRHPRSVVCGVSDAGEGKAYLYGSGSYANRAEYPFPDLILLDLKLAASSGSGLDFLAWEKNSEFKDVPVVVLTGSVDEAEKRRALELGAKKVLDKPLGVDALAATLEEIYGIEG